MTDREEAMDREDIRASIDTAAEPMNDMDPRDAALMGFCAGGAFVARKGTQYSLHDIQQDVLLSLPQFTTEQTAAVLVQALDGLGILEDAILEMDVDIES